MIAIIDYGLGNLRSVSKAFEVLGTRTEVTSSPDVLRKARGVVLPGVGAFSKGMENLKALDILPTVSRLVKAGKPILGICLGFQLLFSESSEHGRCRGLDFIKGKVRRFDNSVKIPHMGWNRLQQQKSPATTANKLFDGIPDGAFFYFVHSYYAQPQEKDVVAGTTCYGGEFCSVVAKDNIMGVQFHPEKSARNGLMFLKNFLTLCQAV